MTERNTGLSANEAWKALFGKYPIAETVEREGIFQIRADQIREFREPRLMGRKERRDF